MSKTLRQDVLLFTLPSLQFAFDGFADQINPRLAILKGGVHTNDRLPSKRESQPLGPKLFPSHVFRTYVIDDCSYISYVRNNSKGIAMATTDQLRKAQQNVGLTLNSFPRERYIRELEAAGQSNLRRLTKVELFKRIRAAGIQIKPDWRPS